MIMLALSFTAVLAIPAQIARAESSTWYVAASPAGSGTAIGASCTAPSFNTIGAAISAASSGDTIIVCPGTYTEQVAITTSLTLESSGGASLTTIQAPSSLVADGLGLNDIVDVMGGTVTINGFTISGPVNNLDYGIFVGGGATVTIENNNILSISDNPMTGSQHGGGIRVGSSGLDTIGTATITNNVIAGYQKGGIVVDGSGSSAVISGNTVTGVGPTATIAQNGIQISRGATGTVEDNTVSGNVCLDPTQCGPAGPSGGSTGILIFQSAGVSVTDNQVTGNDYGLYAAEDTGPVTFGSNTISDSTYFGVAVEYETVSITVSDNSISSTLCANIPAGVDWGGLTCGPNVVNQVQGLGIGFWDNSGSNLITGNTLTANDIGVSLNVDTGTDTVTGNTISGSTYFGIVPYDQPVTASGNTFSDNPSNFQAYVDTLTMTSSCGNPTCVSSDQTGITGVSVSIAGSSATAGTGVTIVTTALTAPSVGVTPGTLNNEVYFDVQVTGISDGTATVCVNDLKADASTILQYWNAGEWVTASNVVSNIGSNVCGDVPVSALTGTNFGAGDPSIIPAFPFAFGIPIVLVATALIYIAMRKSLLGQPIVPASYTRHTPHN